MAVKQAVKNAIRVYTDNDDDNASTATSSLPDTVLARQGPLHNYEPWFMLNPYFEIEAML